MPRAREPAAFISQNSDTLPSGQYYVPEVA